MENYVTSILSGHSEHRDSELPRSTWKNKNDAKNVIRLPVHVTKRTGHFNGRDTLNVAAPPYLQYSLGYLSFLR